MTFFLLIVTQPSLIHSFDLYSASSRHYYSDALPAQSRPKKDLMNWSKPNNENRQDVNNKKPAGYKQWEGCTLIPNWDFQAIGVNWFISLQLVSITQWHIHPGSLTYQSRESVYLGTHDPKPDQGHTMPGLRRATPNPPPHYLARVIVTHGCLRPSFFQELNPLFDPLSHANQQHSV